MIGIALIAHLSEVSGAGLALLETAKGLNQEKFRPILVLPGHGPLLERALQAGVETHVIENEETGFAEAGIAGKIKIAAARARYTRRLRALLRASAVDIAYINSTATIFPGIAAQLAGKSILWHVHETVPQPRLNIRIKQRIIEQLSDAILYASTSALAAFPAHRVKKKMIVRNFVDVQTLADSQTGRDIRAEFNIAEDERIVMMSGMRRTKGTDLFLAAAQMVAEAVGGKLRFIVVGEPASPVEGEELEHTAREIGTDIFLFAGLRTDVSDFIKSVDVLVSPSRSESLPGILIEAMAAGTPVIATDIGDCALLLENGRAGKLIPPENAQALADGIIELLRDPESAKKLANMAQEKVLREYAPENFWNSLESFLESVARRA